MRMLLFSILLSTVPLFSQTVVLTNTANGALDDYPSSDFVEGDTFSLQITGAAANSTVTLIETVNGSPSPANPWTAGTSDGSGNFAINATVTPGCCVSHRTQQWYVGGVAVGTLLDFETIYKPGSGSTVISVSVASQPTPQCDSFHVYGVFADVRYQIKNAAGTNVVTQTGIGMIPTEEVTVYNQNQTVAGSYNGDVGPVSGYSDSAQFADSDGTFHDVPWGGCGNATYTSFRFIVQDLSIYIGNNNYDLRTNTMYIASSSANHGSVTNNTDISVSR